MKMRMFGNGVASPNGKRRRDILAFTWPVILTNLLHTLTVTVDMIMLGQIGGDAGRDAIAAVGLGGQITFLSHSVMMAISAGTIALVARSVGAGDRETAGRAMEQSIIIGLVLSIPIMLAGWFLGGGAIALFGAEAEVNELGKVYIQFVFLGSIFNFFSFILAGALRGAGDMKTPLAMAAITNTVNIIGNYILIFGHFGFPAMGVKGAAIANTLGFMCGSAVYLVLLLRGRLAIRLPEARKWFDGGMIRRIMKIGVPAATEQGVLQVGFLLYTAIIVYYGTAALAGHQIGARIQSLAFMPGMGFAMAATALVGQNLGAKNPGEAEQSGWESTKLSMLVMCGIGAVMFVFAEGMASLFINDAETIRLTALWMRLQALAMPAIGMHFTLSGALRGAGDTRWPLWVSAMGMFAVRLPIAIALGFLLGIGILGAWIAFVIEYNVRAVIMAWRFRKGHWKTIKV